eukprot:GDKH01007619.1.p1 GENE.GDKH01007619.1~~GDKH01007619.1.p1  ORF type:complete len:250 (-),score=32.01 GDKH01007619.1:93-842(-)
MLPILQVALFPPNLISIFRLFLGIVSFSFYETHHATFMFLYSVSLALDMVDGYVARQTGTCTTFGATLDVVVDNVVRHALWIRLDPFILGPIVVAIEWTTFGLTQGVREEWKNRAFRGAPWIVSSVMRNHYRNGPGALVITGLFGLPLFMYADRFQLWPDLVVVQFLSAALFFALVVGRLWGVGCELWVISRTLCLIAEGDIKQLNDRRAEEQRAQMNQNRVLPREGEDTSPSRFPRGRGGRGSATKPT